MFYLFLDIVLAYLVDELRNLDPRDVLQLDGGANPEAYDCFQIAFVLVFQIRDVRCTVSSATP